VAGGTSEETNSLAYNEVLPVVGIDGQNKTALSFNNPNSYVASIKHGGKFSVAVSFEISAWFKIDSLPQKSAIPYNLIGKFTADSSALPSEFSLALVNGACGAEAPAFAFFLTDETSLFACEEAVLSKNLVKTGIWTYVEAKWDGRYLTLFQDGITVAKEERILAVLPFSELPVYLGKSGVPFAIDGLSFNTEAL
ncbi:MAG: LamG domain-containing protein, partial [Fibromonadaceae bacterium]|nr:LamG domain-containing protein [Fibromonadaceae bacterium]